MSYVTEAYVKARKNPTDHQLMRRLRRPPESDRDPRVKNDAYWALRFQGYPHSYAKRAVRDQQPTFQERTVSIDAGECDPEHLLFPPGSTWVEPRVAMRPVLSEETIEALEPRQSEYTVWDHVVPGFGVRVRIKGHKSFIVYRRVPNTGRLQKHTLGKITELSLEQARQAARTYRCASECS
ncbi:hypothetical protein BH10PSE14_BH10PSE14_18870 [soil metagenome]